MNKRGSEDIMESLFKKNVESNHYQHHNMPARPNWKSFDPSGRYKYKEVAKKMMEAYEIGRELYPTVKKQAKNPGPGTYDYELENPKKGFNFSKKTTLPRKIKPSQFSDRRIGPGSYTFQKTTSESLLSQHRKTCAAKFFPAKKEDRLNFGVGQTPGPGKYKFENKLDHVSNFSQANTHRISMTQRSDIVSKTSNLAPGYYNWEKYYSKEKEKEKKPIIEYKFVHGNA